MAVRGERRGRRAAFSSFAGVAQRLLQIAGTLIVMPMVLHAVGSEGFGVWAAAASFFWMTVVVDFGVGQALLTNVAQNVARGDIAEIRRQIGAALLVSLVLGIVGTILAVTIIPRVAPPPVADAYLIAAVLLSINIPLSLTGNVWTGLQRFHMTSAWETFQTIVTVCGLFALTRFSTDTRYYVAVTAGGLLVANVASTINLYSRYPELLPSVRLPSASRCLALMQRAAPFFILSVAATLAINLDSVVALSRLGADAASRMAVAQRACLTALGLMWVVTQPLWPAVTDAATRGDHLWVRRGILWRRHRGDAVRFERRRDPRSLRPAASRPVDGRRHATGSRRSVGDVRLDRRAVAGADRRRAAQRARRRLVPGARGDRL